MFGTMKRLIKWSGSRKKRLYIGFIWSFLCSVFTAMPVMGAAFALNLMLEQEAGMRVIPKAFAAYLALFMAAMVLGRFVFAYLRATYQEAIGHEVTAEKRIQIGGLLKRVSLGFFDKNDTGSLIGAVTTDLSFVEMYTMKMMDTVAGGYISTFTMILALAFYSRHTALIALCGIAASSLALALMGSRSKKNAPAHQRAQNEMIAATLSYIRGLPVVKSYGQEGVSVSGLRAAYRMHRSINVKIEKNYVPCNCLHLLALKAASVIMCLEAGMQVVRGSMAMPVFLMIAIFSFILFGHAEQINNAVHVMQIIAATLDKLEVMEQAQFIDETGREIPLKEHTISLHNVSFSYGERRVLENISCVMPQNTTTAIIGPSGSGKTTLCRLIARFYDVDAGKICIGGQDISEMTCDSLFSGISMVFQNVYLFHDTIWNNICFGRPETTREEVERAAKQACCHDFICALPNGYDTLVGEGGASLSGGEKQRISIARAILKDAPIVILDEATASIDPENEHQIQRALSALTQGKTMIVIAHRLATIAHADQILVLDEGKIVQRGTHQALLGQEGIYKKFISIREEAEGWQIDS